VANSGSSTAATVGDEEKKKKRKGEESLCCREEEKDEKRKESNRGKNRHSMHPLTSTLLRAMFFIPRRENWKAEKKERRDH